jgi:hypothetical protein
MTQKGMEEAPKPLRIPSLKLNIKLGLFNHLKNSQDPSKAHKTHQQAHKTPHFTQRIFTRKNHNVSVKNGSHMPDT